MYRNYLTGYSDALIERGVRAFDLRFASRKNSSVVLAEKIKKSHFMYPGAHFLIREPVENMYFLRVFNESN